MKWVFIFLLLFSSTYAFEYGVPPCFTYSTLAPFGISFTVSQLSTIYGCNAQWMYWGTPSNYTTMINGTASRGGVLYGNRTLVLYANFTGSGINENFFRRNTPSIAPRSGEPPINISLTASTNNYANNIANASINAPDFSISAYCAGLSCTDQKFMYIEYWNATHARVNGSFYVNISYLWNITVTGTTHVYGEALSKSQITIPTNSTNGPTYEMADGKSFYSTNNPWYSSIFGGRRLRSDKLPNITSYPGEGLFFNNVLLSPTAQIILPEIVYFPGNDSFPYFYNSTNGASFMKNNTAAYIYDLETLAWYFVPPLPVNDLTLVYTESVYYVASSQTSSASIPIVALYSQCMKQNNSFTINSSFFANVNHTVLYGNATAALAYQVTAPSLYYVLNMQNYTYANYSVNGNFYCAYSNQTQLLPMPQLTFVNTAGKTIMMILFLGTTAFGLVNPFALVFSATFNDVYSFLTTFQMAVVVVGIGATSLLIKKQSASLKALFLYVLLGISILFLFQGQGVPMSVNMVPLQNLYTSIQAFSTNESTTNIYSFTIAAGSFLVNLGVLIISIPGIARDLVMVSLYQVSPPIASVAAPIADAIVLAMILGLFLFLYEIIRNLFPRSSTGSDGVF